jgi:serine/threonine protein kinase
MRLPPAALEPATASAAGRTPRQLLEEGLGRWFDRPVRIASLNGEPLERRSTYPIDRLWVTLDSGEQLPVIFKRLQAAEGPKGNRREVLVYRRLLDGGRFGAPALYASAYDEPAGRYWLFLEDVGENSLKAGDDDDWLAAVRLLARMHGEYLGREEALRALGCLGEQDAEYYHAIARTARRHLDRSGAQVALARFDALMARFPSLVAHLVRPLRTLVHGDIFPENLLLQPDPRVRLVDWESAAVGLGTWDLARLLDGWGDDKPAFIAAYLDALAPLTPVTVDRRDFDHTFAGCEVLNVLWHFGWEEEACRDAAFVESGLEALAAAWQRLEGGAGNG